MASTNSLNLRLELIGTGDQPGTWGTTTNNNLAYVLDASVAGYQTVNVSSANQALTYQYTPTSVTTANQSIYAMLRLTTSTTAAFSVYAPPNSKTYIIWNNSGYAATIYNSTAIGNTTAAGTGVTIPNGSKYFVFSNGTNFYTLDATSGVTTFSAGSTGLTPATSSSGAVTLAGTLAVANGGTGQVTQQAAINALAGATTNARFLRGDGTNVTMAPIQASDVPTLNQSTTGSAGSVATTNFSIVESGGKLYFKYGATNLASLDSSGNFVVLANVTGYGTP